jgi:hypothetical protein
MVSRNRFLSVLSSAWSIPGQNHRGAFGHVAAQSFVPDLHARRGVWAFVHPSDYSAFTLLEASEAGPGPALFAAVTVNV